MYWRFWVWQLTSAFTLFNRVLTTSPLDEIYTGFILPIISATHIGTPRISEMQSPDCVHDSTCSRSRLETRTCRSISNFVVVVISCVVSSGKTMTVREVGYGNSLVRP